MAQSFAHLHETLGFEQRAADACVLRLADNGAVTVIVVGPKKRCSRFCEDLHKLSTTLGELC